MDLDAWPHERYMKMALAEAEWAARMGEVPVGAVLVDGDGRVVARAHNLTRTRRDPTAHAEILALRRGSEMIGNYRLLRTRLYATIEPCMMCMGASIHARVEGVVFGAADPRWGAAGSLYDLSDDPRLNHRVRVISGIEEAACLGLLQAFFRARRSSGEWPEDRGPRRPPG